MKIISNVKLGLLLTAASMLSQQIAGADITDAENAAAGPECTAAQPFYWEIGRRFGGPIASGSVGGPDYDRDTVVGIASASKWIFGAYILERYNGLPVGQQGTDFEEALTMRKGHTSFNPILCGLQPVNTVRACHLILDNDVVDPTKVGFFNYGGGDGQFAATDGSLADLGPLDSAVLLTEVNTYLNLGSTFSYNSTGVSGGMAASAADYATFLQKVMRGTYEMGNFLGSSAVDTQCAECRSPFGTVDVSYSLNHWVEDNPGGGALPNGAVVGVGDGSFSSPGALGFYPWINDNKRTYGIISTVGSFPKSYTCGKAIREAFFQ